VAGPGGLEVGRAGPRSGFSLTPAQFGKSLGAYIQRIERSLKVEIPTEIDKTGFRKDMAEVQAEAAKSAVSVKVKPTQLDDFGRRVKAEAAKLSRQIEVDIPATVDGEKFRRDAAAKIEALGKLLEVKVPIDIERRRHSAGTSSSRWPRSRPSRRARTRLSTCGWTSTSRS
jgi:hypothetical protein